MYNSLLLSDLSSNELFQIFCLLFACFRIYLEIIGFDFNKLPITKKLSPNAARSKQMVKFHKMGLYFSLGFVVCFAPGILLS